MMPASVMLVAIDVCYYAIMPFTFADYYFFLHFSATTRVYFA